MAGLRNMHGICEVSSRSVQVQRQFEKLILRHLL